MGAALAARSPGSRPPMLAAALMARKPVRRGRPRSLESEEAILEATGKLLSREGYLGLTVSKVAARARAGDWIPRE